MNGTINRRDFVRLLVAGSAGLVFGAQLDLLPKPAAAATHAALYGPTPAPAADFTPNLFLTITPEDEVIVTVQRSEMGQGVRTALAMCLADELDADWPRVRIEQAPGSAKYGDQTTGGSVSISSNADLFRAMGASARNVLIHAAAAQWDVDPVDCTTDNGAVVHPDGKQRSVYGDLVTAAAALKPADLPRPELKSPEQYRLIGTRMGNWDAPQIVTGAAVYGLDTRLPGMAYATIARPPVVGAALTSYDDKKARAVEGVRDVVAIASGIAVVADNSWAAMQGRKALQIKWDEGPNAAWTTASIHDDLLDGAPQMGSAKPGVVEGAYDLPYEAHVPMEPMNCTADVKQDGCDIWAPTQDPQNVQMQVMLATGLPRDAVRVHVPLIGGAFGRRLEADYAVEAALLSQAIKAPVQVVWTRDDDIRHDFYHPMSYHYVSLKTGEPFKKMFSRSRSATTYLPTGAWRSVDNFPAAYARECFVDEYAAATGIDPYALRLQLVDEKVYAADARAVLELAAQKSGWGKPLPDGWGRGMAFHSTFGVTHVAHVAEVEVDKQGQVRVHRVVSAVDCGEVINPGGVEAQIEGGIAFGLTAALKDKITIKDGRVEQGNFDDFGILRLDEMPAVEVYIVPSDRRPTGIGEMGVPPIVPAVLNAIYAATGLRVREIPVKQVKV
jgi:isoquinoline 1-oxidoreductase subunit beta